MTKANCVRPGIMSLIRVKYKGDIAKTQWLDLLHNRGYVTVDVSNDIVPQPLPPAPATLMLPIVSVKVTEAENSLTFTRTADDYDITIEAVNEELESTFTATVEKDGESAGTASLCFKIFDENAEEIEIVNLADATSISPVSERAWEITVSGHVINLWYEVDAESGTCHIMASTTLTDEGEPFVGSAELYVKCEEE